MFATIISMAELVYYLAAGEKARVECGRSGTFVAMDAKKVTLRPAHLETLERTFDASQEHLCKIGHLPIRTDTPNYGFVVGLQYDRGRDRLLADIVPTPALVRRNREELFTRCSMELDAEGDEFRFEHLAFLAARRPAIDGLAPIMLASSDVAGIVLTPGGRDDAEVDDPQFAFGFGADPVSLEAWQRVKRLERTSGVSFAEAMRLLADAGDETVTRYLLSC